jgi:hypothetical protein
MSFIANKGIPATYKEGYQTNKGYDTKSVLVDEKMYLIHIPNQQNKSKEYSKSKDNYKIVYEYLKNNYKTEKTEGGLNLPKDGEVKDGDDDVMMPHIRAIRKAFEETGEGWGIKCKFWYDNLYLKNTSHYQKTMYIAITPTEGDTVRRKRSTKKPCEETVSTKDDISDVFSGMKVSAEKDKDMSGEKVSAEKVSAEEDNDVGGETHYKGRKLHFGPLDKSRGSYPLFDWESEDGYSIGDYEPERGERPDSYEAKTIYQDRDHFVIQAFGYDKEQDYTIDSDGAREFYSEDESYGDQAADYFLDETEDLPLEKTEDLPPKKPKWGEAMSKTRQRKYWYDTTGKEKSVWEEPEEHRIWREYTEKKAAEEEAVKKAAEAAEAAEKKRAEEEKNLKNDKRNKLRERLKAARRNKGGARKTKRKQSKGKRKTRKN